jgi:hypothetical protein
VGSIAAPETGHIGLTIVLTALLVGFAVRLGVTISRRINPNQARAQLPSQVKRRLLLFGAAYLAALIAVVLVIGLLTGNWIIVAVTAICWIVILQMASVLMRALRPRHRASLGDDVPTSKSKS